VCYLSFINLTIVKFFMKIDIAPDISVHQSNGHAIDSSMMLPNQMRV